MAGMREEIMNTILVKAKKIIGKRRWRLWRWADFLAFFGAGTAFGASAILCYGGYGRPYRVYAGRGITTDPRRFMLDRCTARTDITDHTVTTACIASG